MAARSNIAARKRRFAAFRLDGGRTIAREEFSFGEDFEVEVNLENGRAVVLSITSRRPQKNDAVERPERITNDIPVDLQVVAALGQRGAK